MDGGGWGDTSDESDWDCDDTTAGREADGITSPTPTPPSTASSAPPFQWDSVLEPACARAESADTPRAKFVEERQPLQQVSAGAWVGTEALSGGTHVVTEAELCRAALLALQGVPSAAFPLDEDADVFHTCTRLRVRHLSSASLLVRSFPVAAPAARQQRSDNTTPCAGAPMRL